jgi:hypothetical protein
MRIMKTLRQICDIAALNGLKNEHHTQNVERSGSTILVEFLENASLAEDDFAATPHFGKEYDYYVSMHQDDLDQLDQAQHGCVYKPYTVEFECGSSNAAETLKRGLLGEPPLREIITLKSSPASLDTLYATSRDVLHDLNAKDLVQVERKFSDEEGHSIKLRYRVNSRGSVPTRTLRLQNLEDTADLVETLEETARKNLMRDCCILQSARGLDL